MSALYWNQYLLSSYLLAMPRAPLLTGKNGNFKWVGVFSIPLFRAVDLALNRATFYLRPDQLLTGVSYV